MAESVVNSAPGTLHIGESSTKIQRSMVARVIVALQPDTQAGRTINMSSTEHIELDSRSLQSVPRSAGRSDRDQVDEEYQIQRTPSHQSGGSRPDTPANRASSEALATATDDDQEEGGLRGWTVVSGSAVGFFVTLGLVYSFGVLQSELISRGTASASTLGWVSSTTVVMVSIFAVPLTSLVARWGSRPVGLAGAMATGLGYFLTSFALESIPFLFVAQSIFGLGYAAVFWASNTLAAQYFVHRRGLAVGIVYAGSGIGGGVFGIGLSHLIQQVGLKWAIRTYGLVAWAILIPASLTFRERYPGKSAKFSLSIFRDARFSFLFLGTALSTFPLFVAPFFLPTYAVSAGYSHSAGAWFAAGYNFASALGRILFGMLADTRVGPVTTLVLALLTMGSSMLCIWLVSGAHLAPLALFVLLNGASSGAILSLQPSVNAGLFGTHSMPVTMSMLTMARCAGSFFGAPLAGIMLDHFGGPHQGTGPYAPVLAMFGTITITSAMAVWVTRWCVVGWDLRKRV